MTQRSNGTECCNVHLWDWPGVNDSYCPPLIAALVEENMFLPGQQMDPGPSHWVILRKDEEGMCGLCAEKTVKHVPYHPCMVYLPRCGWFVWFSCRQIYKSSHGWCGVLMMKSKFTRPAKLLQWFQQVSIVRESWSLSLKSWAMFLFPNRWGPKLLSLIQPCPPKKWISPAGDGIFRPSILLDLEGFGFLGYMFEEQYVIHTEFCPSCMDSCILSINSMNWIWPNTGDPKKGKQPGKR